MAKKPALPAFDVDETGDWHWRMAANNNRIVANGRGFNTKASAERGFRDAARVMAAAAKAMPKGKRTGR